MKKAQLKRDDNKFKAIVKKIVIDAGQLYHEREFLMFGKHGTLGLSEAGVSALQNICVCDSKFDEGHNRLFGWLAEKHFPNHRLDREARTAKSRALHGHYGRMWKGNRKSRRSVRVLVRKAAQVDSPVVAADDLVPKKVVHRCTSEKYKEEAALFEAIVTEIFTDAGKPFDRDIVLCTTSEDPHGVSRLSVEGLKTLQEVHENELFGGGPKCSFWRWICNKMYPSLTTDKKGFFYKRIQNRFNCSTVSRGKRSSGACGDEIAKRRRLGQRVAGADGNAAGAAGAADPSGEVSINDAAMALLLLGAGNSGLGE